MANAQVIEFHRLFVCVLFSQVKIMEIKQPRRTDIFILVTGRQLLKDVHITKLQLVVFVDVIMKSCEKPVLVEIIVDDLLAKIHKYLVGQNQRKGTRLKPFFIQGKLGEDIIAKPEIKVITVG